MSTKRQIGGTVRISARHRYMGRAAKSILLLVSLALLFALLAGSDVASGAEESAAARTSTATELPGKRTATSNTFRLPSGELQTDLYQAPVNFEDDEGDWKPINEELKETASGIVNGENSFDLQLPQQIGSGAVRLSEDDQWVSFRFLGTPTEAAEVEDATAAYESQSGRFSFELRSLPTGLKEAITLNDPSAPSVYRYEMQLAAGLEPKLSEDGSIAIRAGEGNLFATVAAPTIEEANNGLAGPSDAIHYSLEEGSEGKWTLSVEADEGWLQSPGRSFPVRIDPSPALIATEQDCTIGSLPAPKGWTACGNSGATELSAGYSQKENQPSHTFPGRRRSAYCG